MKALANKLSPAVSIGKAGLTESIVNSIDEYLEKNELIKVSMQQGVELDAKEVCNEIAGMLRAEYVQAVGRRFVLYRRQPDAEKRKVFI